VIKELPPWEKGYMKKQGDGWDTHCCLSQMILDVDVIITIVLSVDLAPIGIEQDMKA